MQSDGLQPRLIRDVRLFIHTIMETKNQEAKKVSFKDIVNSFNLPQIIRFLYSGFLFIGLLQLSPSKAFVNDLLKSLGSDVLSFTLIAFIGVFIWTIYHQVIGEFFFFHVAHIIHRSFFKNSSDMQLLIDCGVPFGKKRMAYEMLRNFYFESEVRQWVELNHAHNQLLDVTWIEIVVVIFYFYFVQGVIIEGFYTLFLVPQRLGLCGKQHIKT